jgi:Protein of unknown function (DUF2846)
MIISKTLRLALLGALVALPASSGIAASKDAPRMSVVVPTPAAGKGQVVFFRPSAMGMAIRCTIRENGKMVGRVGNGKYMIITADPGAHKYTTKTEATDELNLEVEPDETTYVKCKIAAGIMAGRPNLSPATKADFDAKSAKLEMQDMSKLAEDEAELAKAGTAK